MATILENGDWCQLSPKKFEKFLWKLKAYKPYLYPMSCLSPSPPGFLGNLDKKDNVFYTVAFETYWMNWKISATLVIE